MCDNAGIHRLIIFSVLGKEIKGLGFLINYPISCTQSATVEEWKSGCACLQVYEYLTDRWDFILFIIYFL